MRPVLAITAVFVSVLADGIVLGAATKEIP